MSFKTKILLIDLNSATMQEVEGVLRVRGEIVRSIQAPKSDAKVPITIFTSEKDPGTVQAAFKQGVSFSLVGPVDRVDRDEVAELLNATRGGMLEGRRKYQRVPLNAQILCEWGIKTRKQWVAGKP